MKKSLFTMAALAALATTMAGCSLAPVYERPAQPVAPAFPHGDAYQGVPQAAADAKPVSQILWREYFADPKLRKVIELALANNRDLRVSVLNIEKAKAQYNIDTAALLPKLSANVSQSATRTPSNMTGTGQSIVNRQYNGGLVMSSYELDFFGKVRNQSEAGLQSYLGTEEARRTQQITLVSEVANAYLTLIADQQRLKLAQETLKSQQTSYDLSRKRFASGVVAGTDMYDAQTSVETARNDAAVYTAQVALDQNALALLVGSTVPDDLLPTGELEEVTQLAAIPAGLPSDLLQSRPDVQEAERSLRAANANIGVARAAFFPSISLTASGGSASSTLSGLFKAGSSTWSFAPQINLPIFDGGVNRANLNIAKADRDISVAQYEKSIQTAFREVADALATRGTLDQRLASSQALVEASQKSYTINEARYRQGADTYLNALVSQRALYTAQQGLITTRLAKNSNAVTLYKVLGGGWQPELPPQR
ncbi:AdeC/AdeK/OprM family multidrug efflux complex outer membrane factor [Duganella sp. FT109W]|uniref:AdeC/AdeK/OprM family multidrug efflux complex outer membrane factor n=1 Tax=Duganella margarita TaxID=2692170 RepID=A0A7X4KJX8_9BURK|nr:AdeC/AdeK/OprM family multidrug efflux complex outer membrane factor [Duganella margarita]MYM76045.1 AdeC/AdeK/OprM family multidrug efflux complex outer membrane factor [Duganella margarita]MYN38928.1 AdeC/AdeK/OprM family multidrug efflux complex outer membrane factor [Duganella margarita]